MSAKDLEAQAHEIAARYEAQAEAAAGAGDVASLRQAKQLLTQAQRELREVKKAASAWERSIKAQAQADRADVADDGSIIGIFVGDRGRDRLAHRRAVNRREISQDEKKDLEPYRKLRHSIDTTIARIETAKERLAGAISVMGPASRPPAAAARKRAPAKKAAAPAAPGAPATPAMWAVDPSGRHELRYWDGTAWTEHVSDQGVASVDALPN